MMSRTSRCTATAPSSLGIARQGVGSAPGGPPRKETERPNDNRKFGFRIFRTLKSNRPPLMTNTQAYGIGPRSRPRTRCLAAA